MDFLCARHGNTFEAGARAVYIGGKDDPPLTEVGETQARDLAIALGREKIPVTGVFCAPLKRTRRFARIVALSMALPVLPVADKRLTEIDYGDWTGRTNEEIATDLGQGDALRRWNEAGVWPQNANWAQSEAELIQRLEAFRAMLRGRFSPGDTVLIVSSNGVLRYFARGALGPAAAGDPRFPFKMRTGHVGKIRERNGACEVLYWDRAPGADPL